MERLRIAQREIKSIMSDLRDVRGCQPDEVEALAMMREALALIQQAEIRIAHSQALPDQLKRIA